MKKFIYMILAVLLSVNSLITNAQDVNRAISTKIGDALNQLPADKEELFVRLMEDILSTGEDGILMLTDMLKPQGETLPQVEYAIDGIVLYVSRPDTDAAKSQLVTNSLCKALNKISDNYNKAFIIRELQLLKKESSLMALSQAAQTPELYAPAVEAITAVGGEQAVRNIMKLEPSKQSISALAALGSPLAEDDLLNIAKKGTKNLRKITYYALANCGTEKSLPLLKKKSAYDYLTIINRITNTSNYKTYIAEVEPYTGTKNDNNIRIAALDYLLKWSDDKNALVINALNDADRNFRQAAINAAADYDGATLGKSLAALLPYYNDEVKVDALYLLNTWQKSEYIAVFQQYLNSSDIEVYSASVKGIANIGGDEAVKILSDLLVQNDVQRLNVVKSALLTTQGNVADIVVRDFKTASEYGKAVILNIIGECQAKDYANLVISHLNDENGEVKKEAQNSLKKVATLERYEDYLQLLDGAPHSEVAPYQDAVLAALSSLEVDKQYDILVNRMQSLSDYKQERCYLPISKTDINRAVYFVEGNISVADYVAMINKWDVAAEQKLLFLRKLLDNNTVGEERAYILKAIANTNTFLGMMVCGKYLDDVEVANAAAMGVYKIAVNNKQYAGNETTKLLNTAKIVLKNSDDSDADYYIENINKYFDEVAGLDAGYIRIFNEKDLSGWQGLVGNPVSRAQMTSAELGEKQKQADKLAAEQWVVNDDGTLMFLGAGDNLCTIKDYSNFEMYVDWQLATGTNDADAGIYLRGAPQVQIWDTARIDVGAQVGSGGLYNNIVNVSKPLKVADNKLGEWNSFFIKMVGERVTVYLNGELVVDNTVMENYWSRNQPIFDKGAIELQAHGSKVLYRDVYVRELPVVEPYKLNAEEAAEGFELLFDGTSLHKWMGNKTDYITENGVIAVRPTGQGFGDLYTVDEYDDFVFRFEFKLTPGANNGVGIRTPGVGDAAYVGMEIQILDHHNEIYQPWLKNYQYHGSVYGVIPAQNQNAFRPVGEWNEEEIYAKGNYIRVTLNGVVITEGDISSGPVDGREHPGLFNKSGKIGFLGHGSELWSKNIRVKRIVE
jgi:HEAT repeat protein